jgi:hypothetical protein
MHKIALLIVIGLMLGGCGPQARAPQDPVVLTVGTYQVTQQEFDKGFASSLYAERPDKGQARRDYLENLINQKLIILDAQKKGLDRDPEFLQSIERFWEQSLMTVSVGVKTREIVKSVKINEDLTPEQQWQARKEMESRLLDEWMKGLRANTDIRADSRLLQAK